MIEDQIPLLGKLGSAEITEYVNVDLYPGRDHVQKYGPGVIIRAAGQDMVLYGMSGKRLALHPFPPEERGELVYNLFTERYNGKKAPAVIVDLSESIPLSDLGRAYYDVFDLMPDEFTESNLGDSVGETNHFIPDWARREKMDYETHLGLNKLMEATVMPVKGNILDLGCGWEPLSYMFKGDYQRILVDAREDVLTLADLEDHPIPLVMDLAYGIDMPALEDAIAKSMYSGVDIVLMTAIANFISPEVFRQLDLVLNPGGIVYVVNSGRGHHFLNFRKSRKAYEKNEIIALLNGDYSAGHYEMSKEWNFMEYTDPTKTIMAFRKPF